MRRSSGNRRSRSRWLLALLGVTAAITLTGCVGGSTDCADPPSRIEMTLRADSLEPDDPATCRGAEVTLVVTPEVDGVLHIHGYDDEVPATDVSAREVTELSFTAARSGQFPIELHTDQDTEGVTVGLFTVHEP